MSSHSPLLQFITGLPDSPKTEVKGVVLVKGPWYEMPGFLGLPFDLNQSLTFPGLSHLDGACSYLDFPLFHAPFRRGRLVSWVEKANLECIRRMLEITETERKHKLLLSVKNLLKLGVGTFHYIVPVIPRPLSAELIKREHFVVVDLFKSFPGNSSQVGSAQVEVAKGALVKFFRHDQLPLTEQDPQPAPRRQRRRRRKQRRVDKPRL